MARMMRYKCIGYGIITLILYLFQVGALSPLRVFGYTPNFMLLLTLAVAFRESETFAGFYGLICGFLSDVITGTDIGLRAIFYMFLAYFLAVALQTVFRPFFLTYVYITLGCLVVSLFLEYLLFILIGGQISFKTALLHIMLPQFLINGTWSYAVYYIVYRFNLTLKRGGIIQ